MSFSPRNGEVILKAEKTIVRELDSVFQSPQWGSNSKADAAAVCFSSQAVSVPAMGK